MKISSNPHIFSPAPFAPPRWLSNPHLQTILPKFIVSETPNYRRVIVKDSLNESEVAYDFYDAKQESNQNNNLDTSQNNLDISQDSDSDDNQDTNQDNSKNSDKKQTKHSTPIVVLFHGLEGSSHSHYAVTIGNQVHKQGWHYVVPHYRSCANIPVSGDIFYHAGDIKEVHHVLSELSKDYQTVYAIGVSLGGNMLAKYMGHYADEALCDFAVVASAPVDLSSSAVAMERLFGKHIYTPYLLNPLVKKAFNINLTSEEVRRFKTVKMIYDFDDVFTAPRHGYRSVNEYYRQASALPELINVAKPTLLVTAQDDPFLGLTAKPQDISDAVTLLDTAHGGHIGFVQYVANAQGKEKLNLTWLVDTAIEFYRFRSAQQKVVNN